MGLFSFSGRMGRGAFWGINILGGIISTVLYFVIVDNYSTGRLYQTEYGNFLSLELNQTGWMLFLAVAIIWGLIAWAASVKRWHDRDKSGWWILISLVPVIGAIWVFIEQGLLPGTTGPNRFGSR